MLRLHHSPLACSLASRLALAEAGLPHEIVVVRTARGENRTPAYLQVNPRGKVPALQTGDGVLTESTAILPYIADLSPGLLPPAGGFARAQAQAWLSFLSSTVHAAFTGVLRAEAFEGCLDIVCAGQFALFIDEDRERGFERERELGGGPLTAVAPDCGGENMRVEDEDSMRRL